MMNTEAQKARLAGVARRAAVIVVAVCMACAVAGCRTSDELIEVFYTEDAAVIDYDNENKHYEFSEDADLTMAIDQIDVEVNDVESLETIEETIPVFGNPANTDTPIEQVLYDAAGQDRSAPIFTNEPEHTDEADDNDDERGDNEGASNYDPNAEVGGVTPIDDGSTEGEGTQQNDESNWGVSDRGPQVWDPTGGLLEPLTDVSGVATVGEYANVTMMLGGKGVLRASDSAFLGNAATQKIFGSGDWDFSSIPAVWTKTGEDTYELDLDALMAVGVDLVLVPEGMTIMTDAQRDTLLQYGVYLQPVPELSSVTKIQQLVSWLGTTLGVNEETGVDAVARANSYLGTYLGSDVNAVISENGGLTTYNGVDYSLQGVSANTVSNWTVLVTDWDATATFRAGMLANPWTATGLAVARSGYGWSPANYYLSVGGVNNNAAQFPFASNASTTSAEYYIWQFNMSQLNPNDVTNATKNVSFGPAPSSWMMCLVGAPAANDNNASFTTTLGQDDFRYLICTTQEITRALTAQRDYDDATQTGMYAAYGYSAAPDDRPAEAGVGPRTAEGVLARSFIGGGPLGAGLNGQSYGEINRAAGRNAYEIVTCGNGLYCDWVNGSAESFLLAFWTDDFYDGDTGFSTLRSEARAFYKEFYGYDLTDADLNAICAGREA